MKVWKKGEKVEMTYEEVCHALGCLCEVKFVKVTNAGTIGFTAGQVSDVKYLMEKVREKGFKPSRAFVDTVYYKGTSYYKI